MEVSGARFHDDDQAASVGGGGGLGGSVVDGGARADAGGGKADALKTIGGLIALSVGLVALVSIALVGMGFVKTDNPSVVSIATGSFGVIGSIVGAYFGVKIGTDGTKSAIEGMKDESAKAQAFATHMDSGKADVAVSTYRQLRRSAHDPFGG